MSDIRYLVLPRLKLYCEVPNDAEDTQHLESQSDDLLALEEIAERSMIDMGRRKFRDVTVKEGLTLVRTYDLVLGLGNAVKLVGFFMLMRMYDKDAYLQSDYDEKGMSRLRGFRRIGFETVDS